MGMRQRGQLLLIAMIVAALMALSASAVSAHAELKTSDPADKATVTKAPTQIALTFSEETSPTKSGGSVADASGTTVSTGFKVDLNERTKMTIDLKPNLPNGTYTVKWNSFTDDDSGVANGAFTFTIQAVATGTSTTVAQAATAAPAATTAPATTTAPAATVAPTAAPSATIAPTATRAATTPAATGTGGGTAAATTAPAILPKTGSGAQTSDIPWVFWAMLIGAVMLGAGVSVRLRTTRLRR